MFSSGYFSIPYAVAGVGLQDPETAPAVGDTSQIVADDRSRLKRLRPGDNVTLVDGPDTITINAAAGSATMTLGDPSTTPQVGDISLRVDNSRVKRLRSGGMVSLTDNADCVQITANETPVTTSSNSSGLSLQKSGHVFKGFKAGTNVSLVNSTVDDITVDATFTETPLTSSTTGTTLVKGGHTLKDLKAGAYISLATTTDDITIANTYSETPLTTTGVGTSIQKSGHLLKDLKAGSNLTITSNTDDLTLSTPSLVQAGTETSLIGSTGTHSIKSLKAGSGVSLDTSTLDVVRIDTVPATLVQAGSGTSLVGSTAQSIKSLNAGIAISLDTSVADVVTLNNTYAETPLSTSGTGTSLQKAGHVLKDLKAGTNISLSTTTDDVTITNTFTETPITTSGTGTTILSSGHLLKDLKAGTNISLSNTTDDVTINTPTLAQAGTGTTLVGSTTPQTIKSLQAGTNVTFDTNTTDEVHIASTALSTSGTGTSLMKADHVLKDVKVKGSVTATATTDDVTLNTPIVVVGTDLLSYSSVTDDVTTLTVGRYWPRPVASYDPVDYDGTCQDGSTIRTTPSGGTISSLVNKQYRIVSAAQLGHIALSTKLPYTLYPYSLMRPCIQNTVPTANNAVFTCQGFDPFVANNWMICTLAIQYRTPTVLFHKSGEVGQPRISLGIETNTNKRWRVTVSSDAYTPGMYWEPTEIPVATGDDNKVWTYAFTYLTKVGDATKCNQVRLKIQGSAIVTSPIFGDTGWVAEAEGALYTSIPLVAKNITYPHEEAGRTTKAGIGGNTWYLFNHASATPNLTQSWYLFWIYFYPPMTDEQLNAAYAYHNRISNY